VKDAGYQAPAEDGSAIEIAVASDSERLQLLAPFSDWDGTNIENARVLIKAKGKCTTDHISMAGQWLRFRGHLDNIANNTLIGATNFFNGEQNKVKNQITTGLVASNGTMAGIAESLANYEVYFGDANLINTELAKYNKVSREDVLAVAKKYLNKDNRVVLYYVPKAKSSK
jgi:aconitate hydratase